MVTYSFCLVYEIRSVFFLPLQHVFDFEPDMYSKKKFGCVADIGWITGHTYSCYGPLLNGATTLLFESTPTYPDPGKILKKNSC